MIAHAQLASRTRQHEYRYTALVDRGLGLDVPALAAFAN